MTYHVVIVKETTTETLVYGKDGKFVKKLPQKHIKHEGWVTEFADNLKGELESRF